MLDTAGGSTSAPDGDAAIPVSPSPTAVNLPCPCPGHPHEFDTVFLYDEVPRKMGVAIASILNQHAGDRVRIEAEMGDVFLAYGISSWTFTEPVDDHPVSKALLDRWLPWNRGAFTILEAANTLYAGEVFRPFAEKFSTRSPDGQGASSTSATTDSGPTPLRPSKRSSRTGSAGKRSRG